MKIFLSHSSVDKPFVRKISAALISQGYTTWFDEKDILIGESIVGKVDSALADCDVVLVFLSRNSVQSNWVSEEWRSKFFDQVNKGSVYILPLLIEACSIPKLLLDKKYADFSTEQSYENSLSELLRTLSILESKSLTAENQDKMEAEGTIFQYTKELLEDLEDQDICLPILKPIPIVDTLKKITRSGKFVRLDNFTKPRVRIRSIYDHTLSVAHLADCLFPFVNIRNEKKADIARIIAFHEFNETILGDIPSYTNLRDKHRTTTANPAEQTLRTVNPEERERIANEFIWMFLSEKWKQSLKAVMENLRQPQSELTIFFKMLDKVDAIIAVWRYLHHYRGEIEDVSDFLKKLRDFFEYPDVRQYISSTKYSDQLSDLVAVLQDRNCAKNYYHNPDFFNENRSLYRLPPETIKNIIEGCPLFIY